MKAIDVLGDMLSNGRRYTPGEWTDALTRCFAEAGATPEAFTTSILAQEVAHGSDVEARLADAPPTLEEVARAGWEADGDTWGSADAAGRRHWVVNVSEYLRRGDSRSLGGGLWAMQAAMAIDIFVAKHGRPVDAAVIVPAPTKHGSEISPALARVHELNDEVRRLEKERDSLSAQLTASRDRADSADARANKAGETADAALATITTATLARNVALNTLEHERSTVKAGGK